MLFFSMNVKINQIRCVQNTYKTMRIVNIVGLFPYGSIIFFGIAPYCINRLPLLLWYPFDQFANFTIYMTLYVYELLCLSIGCSMFIFLNGYLVLAIIFLNYNYGLLSERASRIGHQPFNEKSQKIETYGKMIELIKLHTKMNR